MPQKWTMTHRVDTLRKAKVPQGQAPEDQKPPKDPEDPNPPKAPKAPKAPKPPKAPKKAKAEDPAKE